MALRRLDVGLIVAGALIVCGASSVSAAVPPRIGVGIQTEPVMLGNPARPGGHYSFPTVYVINNGTGEERVTLDLELRGKPKGRIPPRGWIEFPEQSVTLSPGGAAHLPVHLKLPPTAPAGRYQTWIAASAQTPHAASGTGASLGAAAATTLSFDVAATPATGGVQIAWWLYLAVGVPIVLLLIGLLAWWAGVRIQISRV